MTIVDVEPNACRIANPVGQVALVERPPT